MHVNSTLIHFFITENKIERGSHTQSIPRKTDVNGIAGTSSCYYNHLPFPHSQGSLYHVTKVAFFLGRKRVRSCRPIRSHDFLLLKKCLLILLCTHARCTPARRRRRWPDISSSCWLLSSICVVVVSLSLGARRKEEPIRGRFENSH